ncbi:hypothetical protein KO504_12805 [Winogradskyella psychrotolerans]|uniref:hypothetical protein n=1 Tax=Winogradskyella psychrotolerans TaxID=1344585 RepID=UPI001C07072E|nr:hypothetical protein [Winogradskyella psychrotolerans]MBU2922226.1 hypothetical protein [Winogradskyella psychrotolerans]
MTSDIFINHFNETISEEGKKILIDFFVTFSRFECALKSTIEFASVNNQKVSPNWDLFIISIRDIFNSEKTQDLNEATNFILNFSPRVQTLNNNNLEWIEREFSPNTSDINKLNLHIRDVRNNLFHGGKFNGNYQQDVSRNYRLIKSSLIILNEWLELNEDVQTNFLKEII